LHKKQRRCTVRSAKDSGALPERQRRTTDHGPRTAGCGYGFRHSVIGWPGVDWACAGSLGVSLVPRSNPGHPAWLAIPRQRIDLCASV